MGCRTSKMRTKYHSTKIEKFVSEKEIKLIRETWAIVSIDLDAAGQQIFQRLFEMQSTLKTLFRRMATMDERGEFMFKPELLEKHASMVMKSLNEAVESIDDSLFFADILVDLGVRHLSYNVRPEMLSFLWPPVRDALKDTVGDKFTMEVELAWKHFFDFIICHMALGIRRGEDLAKRAKRKGNS